MTTMYDIATTTYLPLGDVHDNHVESESDQPHDDSVHQFDARAAAHVDPDPVAVLAAVARGAAPRAELLLEDGREEDAHPEQSDEEEQGRRAVVAEDVVAELGLTHEVADGVAVHTRRDLEGR